MKVPTVIKKGKTTKLIRVVDFEAEKLRRWKLIRKRERKKKIMDCIAICSILFVPSLLVLIIYLIWG